MTLKRDDKRPETISEQEIQTRIKSEYPHTRSLQAASLRLRQAFRKKKSKSKKGKVVSVLNKLGTSP
jgi:hypothetical protein